MGAEKEKIEKLLSRNVEEAIEEDHLRAALLSGKKLRVKLGIDPTSPDLHVGHAVLLRKLREFQDLGHRIVLIVGDFTGRIGDPSGRAEAREPLTAAEVKKNMKNYLAQAGKILNIKKTEIVHNSDWFDKEGIEAFVRLAAAGTFEQVLRRADFQKRIEAGQGITFLELLYPLFQGYDSVKVRADVELGGTDQKFNLLTGRHVQRHFGMPEQDVMTVTLLEGLDGVKKMSKSLGNYIGLADTPADMFGKTMSVPDALVRKYFMLCTDIPEDEVDTLTKILGPKALKERLGYELVALYRGKKEAELARENFDKLFSKKEVPDDIPELKITPSIGTMTQLVVASGSVKSNSEARRLIEQGGLDIDQKVQKDPAAKITLRGGEIIKIGKRRFFRVKKG
jgi:tyrosyl-tRNA synthetase